MLPADGRRGISGDGREELAGTGRGRRGGGRGSGHHRAGRDIVGGQAAPLRHQSDAPPTDEPPDAYAWLPYGNAESPTDRLTPRYGTSTDRTSGRRVGVTGLVAAETDPSPATSGGTYAGF